MEVTPQLLNEVEFREARKGYDTRDVDDFLERLGAAIGQLQDELRTAEARLAETDARIAEADARVAEADAKVTDAESRLREASTSEETLRRTLVLAQRTADAAIKEAEESAAHTIAAAEEEATRLVTEARDEAARIKTDGESEARRAVEGTRLQLEQEIAALEETRDALRRDAEALERHVALQRERVRVAVGELQRLLDDPESIRVLPLPDTGPGPEAAAGDEASPAAEDAPVEVVETETEAAEVAIEVEAVVDEPDEVVDLGSGPPTQPVERLDLADDAYLAELRKAMTDDAPLGPRDDDAEHVFTPQDAAAFYEPIEDEAPRPRPRFGRRR
jgi:DivIVA domain-containing protein